MTILNVGCGTKVSPKVVNIDWSLYLRIKKYAPWARAFLGARRKRLDALPDNIVPLNVMKGLPYHDVYAVYSCHFLEHLDRDAGEWFLAEAYRVLRPGGVHRIVVPDLESKCRHYLESLESSDDHDETVALLLEQSVRREAAATRGRRPFRKWLENAVIGDARRRGETHQWMYDRKNLSQKLERAGYRDIRIQDYDTSLIPGWNEIGLDRVGDKPYKPGSLYVEAVK